MNSDHWLSLSSSQVRYCELSTISQITRVYYNFFVHLDRILAVLWCLLSTCLGPPLMQLMRDWWDAVVEGARGAPNAPRRYRGREYEPLEQWEMGGMRGRNRMA